MSTFLYLTDMSQSQASKYVTFNNAVHRLSVAAQILVIDRDLTTAPAGTTNGRVYIVKTSTASGSWSSKGNKIAFYDNGWKFISPQVGWNAYIIDEDVEVVYGGSSAWKLKHPEKIVQSLICSSSITVNWSLGGIGRMTFPSTIPSAEITFSGGTNCPKGLLQIKQSSSGGNAIALQSSQVRGTSNLPSTTPLSTAANKVDYLGFVYHGGDSKYDFVAMNKGF